MGFDLEGRPLPMASDAVQQLVGRALDDPNSQLVAVILRNQGELLLQVMGPPTRETLQDLQQALQTLVDGYAHILKGE
jgi:hypothetical protein